MKKLTVLFALAIFAVSLAAVAGDKKAGEKKVSGTISALDVANRSMTVTDAKSAALTILWNDSTRVKGYATEAKKELSAIADGTYRVTVEMGAKRAEATVEARLGQRVEVALTLQ